MIAPELFVKTLSRCGINFYAGVPDSLLKQLCSYLAANLDGAHNIIAANEGAAVALAAGHYLACGKPGVVYMQNSGEGNAINPLASLTDPDVYDIPVLLVIGWRGRPGVHDEPQHVKQGKITTALLDVMGIEWKVLSKEPSEALAQIEDCVEKLTSYGKTQALIIEKDTFEPYENKKTEAADLSLLREDAIKTVAAALGEDDVIVSTTGMISRELFEYRESLSQGHARDFLTVGSMGHASQIALGIALEQPKRKVWCFDGDGASLMHLGSLAIVASKSPKNYIHVVFNNGAHDSVGGQPTVALDINLSSVAVHLGYKVAITVKHIDALRSVLEEDIPAKEGPVFLEVKVRKGNRPDLGRPTTTTIQNKKAFMDFLNVPGHRNKVLKGIDSLRNILPVRSKVLFVRDASYPFLGIRDEVEKILADAFCEVTVFGDFGVNPLYESVCAGVDIIKKNKCDYIVAVGGGSAIDVAKCIKLYSGALNARLVAIPTTAGTGSESTRFAVMYKDGEKQSVTSDDIIPDFAILEPSVLATLPLYQKKCTMMDALCQGIESWWSVNSTDESKEYSRLAVRGIMENWRAYIFDNSATAAEKIMLCANYAGKAICITQTTAPHAFSYKITSRFGLPHGHAVAVSMQEIWKWMLDNTSACIDRRGEEYLKGIMSDIASAMGCSALEAPGVFSEIMAALELEKPKAQATGLDMKTIAQELSLSVNPVRLKNNPVPIGEEDAAGLYSRIIE